MKSFQVVAYTFQAAICCPDCVRNWARDRLREQGFSEADIGRVEKERPIAYDCGIGAMSSERILNALAEIIGVNLDDYYSFDSDDFPKVVFADQIEKDEACGICYEMI